MSGRRRSRRTPLFIRLSLIVGCVMLVVSGVGLAGMKVLVSRYTGKVEQAQLLDPVALAPGHNIDGAIDMLLVGTDERGNAGGADGMRSDSILLLHIPASHDTAYLMSIPRDTRVTIPAYPESGYRGDTAKINAAFDAGSAKGCGKAGGFRLLSRTVTQLTGLTFNAGVIVNFSGFEQIVDALGGIDMNVDEQVVSVHVGWDRNGKPAVPYRLSPPDFNNPQKVAGVTAKTYPPGPAHFAGWEALDYVRQRELLTNGDYDRQHHQQQFIKALAKKADAVGLGDLGKLDGLLRAVGSALTFDRGKSSIADWLFTLKGINPTKVTAIKANGGTFHSQRIGGQDFETLDAATAGVFPAMKADTLDEYLTANPNLINK